MKRREQRLRGGGLERLPSYDLTIEQVERLYKSQLGRKIAVKDGEGNFYAGELYGIEVDGIKLNVLLRTSQGFVKVVDVVDGMGTFA